MRIFEILKLDTTAAENEKRQANVHQRKINESALVHRYTVAFKELTKNKAKQLMWVVLFVYLFVSLCSKSYSVQINSHVKIVSILYYVSYTINAIMYIIIMNYCDYIIFLNIFFKRLKSFFYRNRNIPSLKPDGLSDWEYNSKTKKTRKKNSMVMKIPSCLLTWRLVAKSQFFKWL